MSKTSEWDILNNTMIDQQLLEILVCPETQTPVRPVDSTLLARVNRAIDEGSIKTNGGQVVTEQLSGGLLREDGAVLYPIVGGIPVMLVDEAIRMDQVS